MRRRWRNRGLALGGSCFVMWVAINLVMVNVCTIVHHVTFAVRVSDGATAAPVEGATISWTTDDPHARRLSTGREGTVVFDELVQQQPFWMFPMVGTLDLGARTLRIAAPGYATIEVRLRDVVPGVPLSDTVARVEVALRRP